VREASQVRHRPSPFTAAEVIWLAAAVLLPWAFNPWGASAFELPKAALLRSLVLLLGVATVGRRHRRPLRKLPLRVPILLLCLTSAAATLTSIGLHVGLWGTYERQQGLLTALAYPLLYLLVTPGLGSRAAFERLWRALVWASGPVVVLGLLEARGLNPLGWQNDAASPIVATLGRSNFVGSYLVLVIPLTARMVHDRKVQPAYGLLLAAQLLCLALTRARAAWLGFAGGAVVALLAVSVAGRRRERWRGLVAPLVSVVLLVAVLLVGHADLQAEPA
jgi:hypothetical protein